MANSNSQQLRRALALIQEQTDPIAIQLNAANPQDGGPGLNPWETHMIIGTLHANVHNLSMIVEKILDRLDDTEGPATERTA